jgi:FHA domain
VQSLSDDLRTSRDQQRVTQQQLSDRAAQLASSQEALDSKSREADRLADERDAAQKESARIRAELDTLGAHASELGRLRAEGVTEAKQLKVALTARNERVSVLETELRVKQATVDLLERSVSRITDLGTKLAALDERMNEGGKPDAKPSDGAEAQPTSVDGGRSQGVVDVGEPTDIEAARRLVLTIDGQTFDYPILKKQMTIGRAHGTDIRVASHFVSRIHATIKTNGTTTIIEDAGSKNGLLVNDERVLRHPLRDGDIVTFGDDVNMRFVDATH